MPKSRSQAAPSQADKFRDLARDLDCDEEAFNAKVRKVATAPRSVRPTESE
jgi:hypothetical protein